MLALIVGIGLGSGISTSEAMRSNLAIVFVGSFVGRAVAYLFPNTSRNYTNESYLLDPLSVMLFTVSFFYGALSEKKNTEHKVVEEKAVESRRMEHVKDQLRAYSELDLTLADVLQAWGRRYNIGAHTHERCCDLGR